LALLRNLTAHVESYLSKSNGLQTTQFVFVTDNGWEMIDRSGSIYSEQMEEPIEITHREFGKPH
jgi:hypothetical protein